jgi:hypothetical protein
MMMMMNQLSGAWPHHAKMLHLFSQLMQQQQPQQGANAAATAAAVSANAAATAAARRWWAHAILVGQHASGYTATGGC